MSRSQWLLARQTAMGHDDGPLLLFSLSKGSRRRSNFFSSNSSLAFTKPLPEAEMSCHSPLRRDLGDVLPLSEAEMSCHSPKRRCNSDSNTMAIVPASATAPPTATHHGVSDSNSLSNNSISSAAPAESEPFGPNSAVLSSSRYRRSTHERER